MEIHNITYMSIWRRLFRLPKIIKNQEAGGLIIGTWTGISYPTYKIYTLLAIRNRTFQLIRDGIFFAVRKFDKRYTYSYPRIRGMIKTLIYLIYVNYFKRSLITRKFKTIKDFHRYKAICGKIDNKDGTFIDKRGRLWTIKITGEKTKYHVTITHSFDKTRQIGIIGTWHTHMSGAKAVIQHHDNIENLKLKKRFGRLLCGVVNPVKKTILIYKY